MSEVISVEILNFLNFGDDDEKRLVGLRQASGRRQQRKGKLISDREGDRDTPLLPVLAAGRRSLKGEFGWCVSGCRISKQGDTTILDGSWYVLLEWLPRRSRENKGRK